MLDPTVRYRKVYSDNTQDGTEMEPRVSSRVITACRWIEGPFLADGTVMHYVRSSAGHTIRLPSLSWTWLKASMPVSEQFLSALRLTHPVILTNRQSVPFPLTENIYR